MSGGVIGAQAFNNNTIGRHNMALGSMAFFGGTPRSAREVLVAEVLDDLWKAAQGLSAHISAMPSSFLRPHKFEICHDICWPWVDRGMTNFYTVAITNDNHVLPVALHSASSNIMRRCQTPRDMIVAIRRIQAATAWCEARAAGRLRQAQEVLRQRRSK